MKRELGRGVTFLFWGLCYELLGGRLSGCPWDLPYSDSKIEHEKALKSSDFKAFDGGPEGDRTLDLTDANRALIPAELRAQMK